MFDFLDSDWFIISLEVLFLLFIGYDAKKYFQTKKKEYLTNIVITIAFFIWASIPFYNSYVTWKDSDKKEFLAECEKENNTTLCECLDNMVFKEYNHNSFVNIDKVDDKEYKEFIEESKKGCLDD